MMIWIKLKLTYKKKRVKDICTKVRMLWTVLPVPHNCISKFYGQDLSLEARYELRSGLG